MSIKKLAVELYRAQQRVDRIQRDIETNTGKEQNDLRKKLKAAENERQVLRKMLDGHKESGSVQKKISQFRSCG